MSVTDKELDILCNSTFLLLKNSLSEKIVSLLSEIESELQPIVLANKSLYPTGTYFKAGKISKGEQYKGLPYFMLDYPRKFTRDEIFAFRTMLWWGHHFSCTLHLQGSILTDNREKLVKNILDDDQLYFCINQSPWEYDYPLDNYITNSELTSNKLNEQIDQNGFIKISRKIPIEAWGEYKSFTKTTLARFLKLIK
ncbi:MAG: hypothetical protein JXR10_09820 [Cyclobacteriaceae bacterium]